MCFVHFQKNTRRVVFIRKRKTVENPRLFKHLSSSLIFASVKLKNVQKTLCFTCKCLGVTSDGYPTLAISWAPFIIFDDFSRNTHKNPSEKAKKNAYKTRQKQGGTEMRQ